MVQVGKPTEETLDSSVPTGGPAHKRNYPTTPPSLPFPRLDSPKPRPDWATLLLARVEQGAPYQTARLATNVSPDTVNRYRRMDPVWSLALDAATAQASPVAYTTSIAIARANRREEEHRRHELAMTASERYAHPYMRLGAEVAGDIGGTPQGAGAPGSVTVQVQVLPARDWRSHAPTQD